jgi:antitoxin HigA-1
MNTFLPRTLSHSLPYCPNRLFDTLLRRLGLPGDGALSRRLKVARKALAAMRAGKLPVGASLLLLIEEATGIAVSELRRLLGDRRARMRPAFALKRT